MAYDQKQFLDLLQEYKSDETKKARRNVSVIAFVIISAAILKIRLAEVRFLGVDVSKSAELPVLLITLVLLAYWTVMFILAWKHDAEIQAERALMLTASVGQMQERVNNIEAHTKNNPNMSASVYPGYDDSKAGLSAYAAQQERTKRAAKYGTAIKLLELYVPLALSLAAAAVLSAGVLRAA